MLSTQVVGNGLYDKAPACPCCHSSKHSDLIADNYNRSLAQVWRDGSEQLRTVFKQVSRSAKTKWSWVCRASLKEGNVFVYKTLHMSHFKSCPFCSGSRCRLCNHRGWLRM